MKTAESFHYHSSFAAAVALAACILTAHPANAAIEKFATSGTFTPPAGITSVTVECWGGGGAGGGATKSTANSGGGGGGGGAYAKKLNIPVTPGTPYTITIPAAATCPASGFTNGQTFDGGAVTFTGDSSVSVTANGGTGGACAVNATGLGGAGGVAGVGFDLVWKGGDGKNNTSSNAGGGGAGASDLAAGNNATASSSTAGATTGGSDADHNGGAGAGGKTAAGSGNTNNAAPGGGGGGGKVTTVTSAAGSPGKLGQIIITYSGATLVKADNTNNLNLGTSWVGGSAPDSAGIAKWDNTVTSANTTVLGANVTWGSINIANPTGLVTVGAGNTLTDNGGIDMSSATADLTLNCGLALGGSSIWNVAAGRTLTLGGIVSGSFNITEQGAGMVILSAANTYSGVTAINGGTLQLGASGVIPDGSGKGDVSVATSCTLDLNSFSDTINGLSGAGIVDNTAASTASTLTVGGNDATSSFTGVIRNSGSSSTTHLVKTGSGTLTLGNSNAFAGNVTVNGGNLSLSNVNALGNISGLTIGGATLGCNSNGVTIAAPITLTGNSTVKVQFSGTLANLNGAIGGTGNLTFATGDNTLSGNNRVSLGAASNFAGNVTITTTSLSTLNNMTVQLGAVNALPVTAVVTLDGQNGNGTSWADLNLFGFDQTLAGLKNVTRTSRLQRVYNSGATATLTINNSADCIFGGNLGKTGGDDFGLTKSGGGIFTLSGVSTYAGATIVSGGKLAMGADNTLPGSTAVSIGNATLDAATFANTVGTLDVTSTAKINFGTGAALAFADSSAEDWTGGTLDLTGTFVSGASLRFGDGTGTGLTPTQLGLVTATGFGSFALDASGYLTATATGGYSSWKTANSTSQAIDLDHDSDGVSNGVECFLGGSANTTGFTALPGVANAAGTLTITWTKAAGYSGVYGTDFVVETSSTLTGVWTTEIVAPNPGSTVTITGNDVKYTFPAGTKNFARLKVTGP